MIASGSAVESGTAGLVACWTMLLPQPTKSFSFSICRYLVIGHKAQLWCCLTVSKLLPIHAANCAYYSSTLSLQNIHYACFMCAFHPNANHYTCMPHPRVQQVSQLYVSLSEWQQWAVHQLPSIASPFPNLVLPLLCCHGWLGSPTASQVKQYLFSVGFSFTNTGLFLIELIV